MMIFLSKDGFGILKVYGGARRNHGGAARSCHVSMELTNNKMLGQRKDPNFLKKGSEVIVWKVESL